MLHIRVVSPPDLTGQLVDDLSADVGVLDILVMRGVALSGGDAVQFDVQDGSANSVLQQLQRFGLHRDGSISIATVDAAIVNAAQHRGWRSSFHGEQAPVWDLVEARIADDASYAPSFFALLVFAGLIGACGILTNSQILIVGAMVVGPEYSAIISVALGLNGVIGMPCARGLLALLVGFLVRLA